MILAAGGDDGCVLRVVFGSDSSPKDITAEHTQTPHRHGASWKLSLLPRYNRLDE